MAPPTEIDDASDGNLAQQISQAFASGATTVAVDFQAVTVCDSSGLRVLAHAAKLARASGGAFRVRRCLKRHIARELHRALTNPRPPAKTRTAPQPSTTHRSVATT